MRCQADRNDHQRVAEYRGPGEQGQCSPSKWPEIWTRGGRRGQEIGLQYEGRRLRCGCGLRIVCLLVRRDAPPPPSPIQLSRSGRLWLCHRTAWEWQRPNSRRARRQVVIAHLAGCCSQRLLAGAVARPFFDLRAAVVDPAPMMRRTLALQHRQPLAGHDNALQSADHRVAGSIKITGSANDGRNRIFSSSVSAGVLLVAVSGELMKSVPFPAR